MDHPHSTSTSPSPASPTLEGKFKERPEDHFQPVECYLPSPLPGDFNRFLSSLAHFDGQQPSHIFGLSTHPGEVKVVDQWGNKDTFARLAAKDYPDLKADGASNDGNLPITTPSSQ